MPCVYNGRSSKTMHTDFIIVGSGVAGLYTAIRLSAQGRVVVFSKQDLRAGNTWFAQGGLAAAVSLDDSPDFHYRDTWKAGAEFGDPEAISILVNEAPLRIKSLQEIGVEFDYCRDHLDLGREGAHSRNRVLHIGGDATGRWLEETLLQQAGRLNIRFIDNAFVGRLLVREGRIAGVYYYEQDQCKILMSKAVILATGGCGRLFQYTTNSEVVTGDGLALAYRAGAILKDLEFFQFHPTVFFPPGGSPFLISEAVRGEGAHLINARGERFMDYYHPLGELGPRDVVSLAILKERKKIGGEIYIDLRHLGSAFVKERFPTIYKTCRHWGPDIAKQPVAVAPAAHYLIGGIEVDLWGRTALPNLYAVGETASTGVHGANRLASNSLMEGLVFGHRIAESASQLNDQIPDYDPSWDAPDKNFIPLEREPNWCRFRSRLQELMWMGAGVVRNQDVLREVKRELTSWSFLLNGRGDRPEMIESQNMLLIALLMVEAALAREESRGCHYREDYPHADPRLAGKHSRFKYNGEGRP